MRAERLLELERLYHEAAARAHEDRAPFLADACPDADLRSDVQSLLAGQDDRPSFLEVPVLPDAHAQPSRPSLVGHRVDRYEIVEAIGAGGMGEVYRARDLLLEREVALKFLQTADGEASASLLREGQRAARIVHPNVCAVYEVGSFEGRPYLAMEYIAGETLSDKLRSGPLPLDRVLQYATQITDAVAHAHERQVLHRDLKASNVLVTRDDRIKVVDFGIARPLDAGGVERRTDGHTGRSCVVGTPAYMAPEVLRGEPADVRSDIWSIGVLLHEMASGNCPFRGDTAFEVIAAIVGGPPPDLAAVVPAALEPAVRGCLALDRAARFQSARELGRALDRVAHPETTTVPPLRKTAFVRFFHHRGALAASCLVLLALAFTGWWVSQRLRDSRSASSRQAAVRLAVLPFAVDGTGDELLGVGLADLLITRLAGLRLPTLRVLSSGAVRQLHATCEIAKRGSPLAVDYMFCGTAKLRGDNYFVTLQLVRPSDGTVEWGDRFSFPRGRIAELEAVIAERLVPELHVPLTEQGRAQLARRQTISVEAQRHYIAGRALMVRHDGLDQLIGEFENAVRLDPGYARAWAGLAQAFAREYWNTESPEAAARYRARAMEAALRAQSLDPTLGEAHEALSSVYRYSDTDWDKCISEARKALELDPTLELPHHNMATAFYHLGFSDLSDQESLAGLAANPESRYDATLNRARSALYGGNYRTAEQLALQVKYSWIVAEARFYLDHFEESERGLREIIASPKARVSARRARASLASILAAAKRRNEAEAVLHPLLTGPPHDHHVSYRIATAHAQLGRLEEAVRWLKKSAETGFPCYTWFDRDPLLDPVRQLASFRRLMDEQREEWQIRKSRYMPAQRGL